MSITQQARRRRTAAVNHTLGPKTGRVRAAKSRKPMAPGGGKVAKTAQKVK